MGEQRVALENIKGVLSLMLFMLPAVPLLFVWTFPLWLLLLGGH